MEGLQVGHHPGWEPQEGRGLGAHTGVPHAAQVADPALWSYTGFYRWTDPVHTLDIGKRGKGRGEMRPFMIREHLASPSLLPCPHPAPHRKCRPSSVRISICRDRNSSSSRELCSSPGPVTPNISTWGSAAGTRVRRPGVPGVALLPGPGHTDLGEVVYSIQSPWLLPCVCLGPVAGTRTNHPGWGAGEVESGRGEGMSQVGTRSKGTEYHLMGRSLKATEWSMK